jgi:cysteine desulfurase
MRRIYLDHTATTPLDERVEAAMRPLYREVFGNASSVHAEGRAARAALETARAALARVIGCTPGEITFTAGGTESNNLAILGAARAQRRTGRTVILTAAAEHHAVLEPCRAIGEEGGEAVVLPVEPDGRVNLGQLTAALSERTALVTVMHANNEVGTINDLRPITEAAHRAGALVHTDAVQSLGKIPLRVDELGVDLMSLSAHKLYGPKGIGALYCRRGTTLEPVFRGGGQERGRRPGTESVPLAVGFGEAARLAAGDMERESQRLQALRDALETELRVRWPFLIVNGARAPRLPHVLNVSFDSARAPMEGEMLLPNMDLEGISVTSGSACTSGSIQPSHVLLAIGHDPATAAASLRFAFGRGNTADDIPAVVRALAAALARLGVRDSLTSQGS